MELAEIESLKALKEGDETAFEMIFKTYYEPLCNYAFTFLLDRDEAEEMVQDYLELNQLANSFWIVEISDTFDPEEYQTLVDEGERERWDRLEDYSAEDFLEILHSDNMQLL